jgi:hypothetical protein
MATARKVVVFKVVIVIQLPRQGCVAIMFLALFTRVNGCPCHSGRACKTHAHTFTNILMRRRHRHAHRPTGGLKQDDEAEKKDEEAHE